MQKEVEVLKILKLNLIKETIYLKVDEISRNLEKLLENTILDNDNNNLHLPNKRKKLKKLSKSDEKDYEYAKYCYLYQIQICSLNYGKLLYKVDLKKEYRYLIFRNIILSILEKALVCVMISADNFDCSLFPDNYKERALSFNKQIV